MKKFRVVIVMFSLIVVLLVFGVWTASQAQEGDSSQQSYGLQKYEGDGWLLLYPANATLEEVSETELRILGPEVAIRPADMDFQVSGPAYWLDVATYDNPTELSPDVWAEQKILEDWQAIQAEGGPNTLPVTEDGQLEASKLQMIQIGQLPAARVEFFGGDAILYHVYTGAGDIMIVFSFRAEIIENNPIALMQQDIYALIMNTLTFDAH